MSHDVRLHLTLDPANPSVRTHIQVERGLLDRLPALLAEHVPAPMYAVVSDEPVGELYGAALQERLAAAGHAATLFTFPKGEASKTVARWNDLVEGLAEAGLGRDGCVVGLGGGVTTDLAGFAAATYARGVHYVPVPTTLLGMIDAALGGKTGLDLRAGKNLVGALHHPPLVVVDPDVLSTLPEHELRAGLAEAVKHGAIADEEYFEFLSDSAPAILNRDADALDRLIEGSMRIKAAVVGRDAAEAGERAILNFGHTIGHGVERATAYAVHHGEAVSIGMMLEARLGEKIGITEAGAAERLEAVLSSLELATEIPGHVDPEEILAAARTDKKSRKGRVRYALIVRIGTAHREGDGAWTVAVPEEDVREILGPGSATPYAV